MSLKGHVLPKTPAKVFRAGEPDAIPLLICNNSSDPLDRKVSDQIQQYWVNFARAGSPTGAGLPAWSKYDAASTKRQRGKQM